MKTVLMAKRLSFFISSLALLLCAVGQEADSTSVIAADTLLTPRTEMVNDSTTTDSSEDSLKVKKRFISPSFYLDIGKLLTIPTDFETKYEGGVEIKFFERIPIALEIGSAILSPEGAYTNGTYESSGTYFRIGSGYVIPYDVRHDIGLSFRYAAASFDEMGRFEIESPSGAQGNFRDAIDRENLTAQWWEFGLYSDSQLLKESDLLRYGIALRLRILQSYDVQEEIDVYSIPGYGRSFDKTIPSFNFFLKFKF